MTGIPVLLILMVACPLHAFKRRCPAEGHWRLRANIKCSSTDQYTCLSDFNNEMYNESCRGPIVALLGERRVISNKNFDIKPCTPERYQPVIFSSKQGSACLFQKEKCSEEGLVIYSNDTSKGYRSCRCDYTKGFAFLSSNRTDLCSCNVATEDCSCYKKECNTGQVLSPDYICIDEVQPKVPHICSFIQMTESKNFVSANEYEATPLTVNRYEAVKYLTIVELVVLVLYLLVVICLKKIEKHFCRWVTVIGNRFFPKVYILDQLNDQKCIEGKEVKLTCTVNQKDVIGKWKKDGKQLQNSKSVHKNSYGTVHEVVFDSVSVTDEGNYSFQINDIQSSSHLTVSEVNITKGLNDQNCFEGKTVKLTCELDKEDVHGEWMKDEMLLTNSESIHLHRYKKTHALIINRVTVKDKGNYSFYINGKKRASSKLTVSEVIITEQLKDQDCVEGKQVIFKCKVNEEGIPAIWRKDGCQLKSSACILVNAYERIHEMIINRVSTNDKGMYSIHINDETSRSKLTVSEVVITTPLEDQYCVEGQKVTLRCEVLNKNITGTWSKNGKEIKSSASITIIDYGNAHRLTIHKFSSNNSGLYTCSIIGRVTEGYLYTGDKNFINLCHLLKTIVEPVVRDIFDSKIPSDELKTKLQQGIYWKRIKNEKRISCVSYELLYPKVDVPEPITSKVFDIRLMMILLKILIDLKIPDEFPCETVLGETADLSRIKYIRNKIVKQNDRILRDEQFEEDWKHLSQAVIRLGGTKYEQKCMDLKKNIPTARHCKEYLNKDYLQSDQESTSTESLTSGFPQDPNVHNLARSEVRRVFDREFPIQSLEKEIKNRKGQLQELKKAAVITQFQYEDLFPVEKGSLSSLQFDIQVMIILLETTPFQHKEVFQTIKNLQRHLCKPKTEKEAIMQAIREIREVK